MTPQGSAANPVEGTLPPIKLLKPLWDKINAAEAQGSNDLFQESNLLRYWFY